MCKHNVAVLGLKMQAVVVENLQLWSLTLQLLQLAYTLIILLMCHFEWKYFDSVPLLLSSQLIMLTSEFGPNPAEAPPPNWQRQAASPRGSAAASASVFRIWEVVTPQPGLHLSSSS